MALSAEELLAGAAETYEIAVPEALLRHPGGGGARIVSVRPLTVADIQRIVKAAKTDEVLTSALMVKQGLAEPALSLEQVLALPAGLLRFLVEQVSAMSGLTLNRDAVADAVQAPLARACLILAREYGWTPQQVSEMTIGQILLYLEMGAKQQGS